MTGNTPLGKVYIVYGKRSIIFSTCNVDTENDVGREICGKVIKLSAIIIVMNLLP